MWYNFIRFGDIAAKLNSLAILSIGLSLLAFVVLSAINLLSSSVYPTFYGKADRQLIFLIAHITYTLGILLSPIILAYFGYKLTLILGASGVSATLGALVWPFVVTVYAASVTVGFSIAFIITGGYSLICSITKPTSRSRNSALIFTTIEVSQFLSNCLMYFTIEFSKTRSFTYITTGTLLLVAVIGSVFILLTKSPEHKDSEIISGRQRIYDEWVQFIGITTKTEVLLFLPMFFYTGALIALLQGNYGTWPTFTLEVMNYGIDFGTICSLTITTSECVCGVVLILAGIEIEPLGRAFTATLGFIFQGVASFFLIGLVPKDGTFSSALMSEELANSTIILIILMAVLLGFGVALIMTQVYAKLMEQYPCAPAAAITIFKTVQAIGVFTALYYSTLITLPYQSTVCLLLGLVAIFCFVFMERAINDYCEESMNYQTRASESTAI
ncbi:unnamed protein product [Hermetia illucens]|uniref:UNC93-like protein MFSD11 n=1 Tax=Hermetia illucens TaxID=343691 RepID=A0A7R8UMS0_HERIL|nr:uncharacterized protein LOC119650822 [Hermetia illucens]CAD7083681.1 unnamed protein product [Hermetia illucens]